MNETNTTHRIHYEWRIDHYSFYDAKGKDFDSPIFSAETNNTYKWRLRIKFNGENFLGLFLLSDKIDKTGTIFAKYEIAILDDQQQMINSRQCKQIREFKIYNKQGWGFKNFITKNMILNSGLLKNDKLTIYCAVIFSEKNHCTGDFDLPVYNTQLQSVCSEHTICENFESLLESHNHYDVVLMANDKKYYLHKLILAARSTVFNEMFKCNMKANNVYSIDILDMDEKVIQQMIQYIYTDKCDNLKELMEGLFVAACKFDLKGLKLRCKKALIENLSIENVMRILILANMYGENKLKSNTIDFIVANSDKIVNTDTWNDTVLRHPLLFNEVFKALVSKFVAS